MFNRNTYSIVHHTLEKLHHLQQKVNKYFCKQNIKFALSFRCCVNFKWLSRYLYLHTVFTSCDPLLLSRLTFINQHNYKFGIWPLLCISNWWLKHHCQGNNLLITRVFKFMIWHKLNTCTCLDLNFWDNYLVVLLHDEVCHYKWVWVGLKISATFWSFLAKLELFFTPFCCSWYSLALLIPGPI